MRILINCVEYENKFMKLLICIFHFYNPISWSFFVLGYIKMNQRTKDGSLCVYVSLLQEKENVKKTAKIFKSIARNLNQAL